MAKNRRFRRNYRGGKRKFQRKFSKYYTVPRGGIRL